MSTKRKTNRFEKPQTEVRLPTRGLAAVANPASIGTTANELPLATIVPDENQPRRVFDESRLKELAASIAARGVLQPIRVKPDGDKYKIISGERRYRAAKAVGLESIPVVIETRETYSELDGAIDALVENLQRDDLNVVDEVEGIFQLIRMRAQAEHGQEVADELDYAGVEQALNRMRNARSEEFSGLEAIIAETAEGLGFSWKTLAVKKASVWRWPEDVLQALRDQDIGLGVASVLKTIKEAEPRRKWLKAAVDEQFSASTLRARLKAERLLRGPAIESRGALLRVRLGALLTKLESISEEKTELAALEQLEKVEEAMSQLEGILGTPS